MGRRKDRARTPELWVATNELPVTGGHPFYQRLNQVLDRHAFDAFVEAQCFRHQLLLPRPYLVLTKPLRLDIQCQRAASVKIGWKYLDD